jgi:hypothetical protein
MIDEQSKHENILSNSQTMLPPHEGVGLNASN